jgi:type IV secretion system protein VirB8
MSEADNSKNKLKTKSWYSNRYQIVVVQRNILLLFTLISMFSVAVAVIFVKNIMSSKSIEPYIIEVEEKTGIATVVEQMTSQNFTGDQIIRRYFINQFVHAASGYDPRTYKADSEVVRLLALPPIYNAYRSRINARQLGAEAQMGVRIKSVQFTDANTAQIRVLRQIDLPNQATANKDEVITMSFYFSPGINLTLEDRLINPLGFQVSKYLIAEEAFTY